MIKKNEGSVLVIVLISTSLIVLMGIVSFSMSSNNLIMRMMDSKLRKGYYITDGVSEEGYLNVCKIVNQGLTYSYNKVIEESLNQQYIEDKEKIDENKLFIETFKKYIKTRKVIGKYMIEWYVENKNNYRTIEEENIEIYANLEEETNIFLLDLSFLYNKDNLTKRIKVTYEIRLPCFEDLNKNIDIKDIVKIIDWKNLY
ncbi:hypothetical protein CLPU_17c00110 [Gottschalkia purinilytica]|uniref:Uncharacterized protein n=1 Tax=Gottschalkia purinilytica TaxID=1503 RepID=A0A0L0W7D4_GOTPU|nr:hypothetical protein [Gottschalkia purinilytica]KNF07386.1 hypothetical protein CLPU_17c00110 [Gottschalkia purinilytica]